MLLLGTLSFTAALSSPSLASACSGGCRAAFVSAARQANGSFSVLLISADGAVIREVPLSARGHDVALHAASGRAVVFARRPGTFAVAFETASTVEPQIFAADEGRHFFGHGVFSHDGRLLYVTENDIAAGRGVIGIYDVARGYRKIGEHQCYGLGSHEIILLADGKTLAVANGGLDTVPEAGRENLNVSEMKPSLTFVDAKSGELLAKHELADDLAYLSIRHIAADRDGLVWFGGQWEGEPFAIPELIGSAGRDRSLRLIEPPSDRTLDLKGYIGSVAASADGQVIAASAPKAGRVVYIEAASGKLISESVLKDVCGIAPDGPQNFATSSGFGVLRHETARAEVLSQSQLSEIAFDNHLRRLG